MWKHVSHLGATDKANKKYFQRRIQMPTTKYLKHNKWKLIQMREIKELKTKPRIHGRFTGGKSEWVKLRKWEDQD